MRPRAIELLRGRARNDPSCGSDENPTRSPFVHNAEVIARVQTIRSLSAFSGLQSLPVQNPFRALPCIRRTNRGLNSRLIKCDEIVFDEVLGDSRHTPSAREFRKAVTSPNSLTRRSLICSNFRKGKGVPWLSQSGRKI